MQKSMEPGRKRSILPADISGSSDASYAPSLAPSYRRKSRAVRDGLGMDHITGMKTMMGRRVSVMRRGSMAPSSKTDASPVPPVLLENTYRLGPGETERFNTAKVQKVMGTILESFLSGEEYDATTSARLTKQLCDVIKARVQEMHVPRYKVVSYVLIGGNCSQGFTNSSRCIWNTETDNFASATYKNGSLFAVASVYALYYE